MKIYKFKDLTDDKKRPHFLQIVLENTIWCARPDSLNDDEEFKFKLDYEPSLNTAKLLSDIITQYGTTNYLPPQISTSHALTNNNLERIARPIIKGITEKCREEIGVVSFSATNTDDQLWEKYGGNGYGVFIEINIPNHLLEKSYSRVHYVKEKIFHVDTFFESALFPKRELQAYRNILLTKTEKKWKGEEEVRFIGNRQDVNLELDGYISEITFGTNVPPYVFEKLVEKIKTHCDKNEIRINKL